MLTFERFSDCFSGNGELLEKCFRLLSENRFPHAVIVEGDDGLGKSTFARLLARALVCRCEDGDEMCEQCRKAEEGIHPDIKTVIGEGKSGGIPVERIRDVHADMVLSPHEAGRKIYIIEDCEHLPVQSQNALLKMFEEPPAGVFFILTCRTRMSLLTTIRSRAQVLSLLPVPVEDAVKRLMRLRPDASAGDIAAVAAKSGGNIGSALALIAEDGSCTANDAEQKAHAVAAAICAETEQELLSVCQSMRGDRQSCMMVIDSLSEIIRHAVIISIGAADTLPSFTEDERRLASGISVDRLYLISGELNSLRRSLDAYIDTNVLFPAAMCACLRRAAGK